MAKRSDGTRIEGLAGNRLIMPFLMRGRNESVVYFEQVLELARTLPWLESFNEGRERRAHLFHLLLLAMSRSMHGHPRMNRFVKGRRYYQRNEVSLSFAMKPEKTEKASLSVLKMRIAEDEPFGAFVDRVVERVERGRKGVRSGSDQEADVLTRIPAPILEAGMHLYRALDAVGLIPSKMMRTDPMYASAFVANLGSLGMDAAWHHLYEHGTCPIFAVLGKVEKLPRVVGDDVVARTCVRVRYSYDERVADGLAAGRALDEVKARVEDPASWL